MHQFIQIQTTCDRPEVLEQIAERLVSDRLAACVQISGPMTSFYRWQGQVENSTELICSIKTKTKFFERIRAIISEIHSYDLPQVIALPIVDSSDEFSAWMNSQMG